MLNSKKLYKNIKEYLQYFVILLCIILGVLAIFYIYKILFTKVYNKSISYIKTKYYNNYDNDNDNDNNNNNNNNDKYTIRESFRTKCFNINYNKDKNKKRNEKNKNLLTSLTTENYNELRNSPEYKDFFNFYTSLCNKYKFLQDDKSFINEIKSILQLDLDRNITEDIFYGYNEFYDWIISKKLLQRYNKYILYYKLDSNLLEFKDIPCIEIYKYIKINPDTNQEETVIDFYITNKMKSLNLILFNDYIEYLKERTNENTNGIINDNEFTVNYNLENTGTSTNLRMDIETYKIKDFLKYVLDNQQFILRNSRCFLNLNRFINEDEDTLHPSNAFKIYFNNLHIINSYDVVLNGINLTENKQFIYDSIYSGNKHIYYDNKTKQYLTEEGQLNGELDLLNDKVNFYKYSPDFRDYTRRCGLTEEEINKLNESGNEKDAAEIDKNNYEFCEYTGDQTFMNIFCDNTNITYNIYFKPNIKYNLIDYNTMEYEPNSDKQYNLLDSIDFYSNFETSIKTLKKADSIDVDDEIGAELQGIIVKKNPEYNQYLQTRYLYFDLNNYYKEQDLMSRIHYLFNTTESSGFYNITNNILNNYSLKKENNYYTMVHKIYDNKYKPLKLNLTNEQFNIMMNEYFTNTQDTTAIFRQLPNNIPYINEYIFKIFYNKYQIEYIKLTIILVK